MIRNSLKDQSLSGKVNKSIVVTLLVIGDFVSIYSAFHISAFIRRVFLLWFDGIAFLPENIPVIKLCLGFSIILFIFSDLYPGYGLTAVREIRIIVKSLTFVYVFLGIALFYAKVFVQFPGSILFIAWSISVILVPLIRFILRNRLSLTKLYGDPILFIADEKSDFSTLNAVKGCRRMGWNPLVVSRISESVEVINNEKVDVLHVADWEEFERLNNKFSFDAILLSGKLAMSNSDTNYGKDYLRRLSGIFKRVILVYPEHTFGSVWVTPRDLKGQLSLELHYNLINTGSLIFKRFIDILGSLFFLVFLLPFHLLISIMIYFDSSSPILYKHERVGRLGEMYSALKYRTMFMDSDNLLKSLRKNDGTSRWDYMQELKLSGDPRVTRVGKWLRKFSIDEIPQLWNVLRGDMSLVGPRAYLPSELDDLGDYSDLILRIRPGITGWWQVMGRHNTSFEERLRLDEYYISNWSLWLDIYIVFKTIWVIMSGKGA